MAATHTSLVVRMPLLFSLNSQAFVQILHLYIPHTCLSQPEITLHNCLVSVFVTNHYKRIWRMRIEAWVWKQKLCFNVTHKQISLPLLSRVLESTCNQLPLQGFRLCIPFTGLQGWGSGVLQACTHVHPQSIPPRVLSASGGPPVSLFLTRVRCQVGGLSPEICLKRSTVISQLFAILRVSVPPISLPAFFPGLRTLMRRGPLTWSVFSLPIFLQSLGLHLVHIFIISFYI